MPTPHFESCTSALHHPLFIFIYLFIYSPYLARVTCTERPDFQQGPGFTNIDKNIQMHKKYIYKKTIDTIYTSTQS